MLPLGSQKSGVSIFVEKKEKFCKLCNQEGNKITQSFVIEVWYLKPEHPNLISVHFGSNSSFLLLLASEVTTLPWDRNVLRRRADSFNGDPFDC
jgi:hypothetical protein